MIILSLSFFNHCHSYIAVHFLKMFLLLVYFNLILFFGYRLSASRPVVSQCHCVALLLCLRLLLGYHNYYTIHRSPHMSAHILIENTLVEHKMAKNSRMVLCCQNRVSKGTNQCYQLHSSASNSVHSAFET